MLKNTKTRASFLLYFIFLVISGFSQLKPIEVADITIKIGGLSTEELYYGFAEGDEIIFSFEEQKGKPIKEIEIIELPSQSKFMDFKSSSIDNKKVKVNETAVYQFRFSNSSVSGRVCKIHIERIPSSPGQVGFNTGWEWKTLYDTIYSHYTEDSIVGYDTIYEPYLKKELVSVDTTFDTKEETLRVHTRLNANGDKAHLNYSFPLNKITKLYTRNVIGWGYFIGTDEKDPVISQVTGKLIKPIFLANPVGGMVLGLVSIATSTNGNNLDYHIVKGYENVSAFYAENNFSRLDGADVCMAANRYEGNWQGNVYVCLDNDHTYPVDVKVIVTSVMINHYYEMKEHTKRKLEPVKIVVNKTKTDIETSRVRVNIE